MNKLKNYLSITILFLLLFLVAFTPRLFTEIKNQSLLKKPYISDLNMEEGKVAAIQNYNIINNIKTIAKRSGFVTIKNDIKLTKHEIECIWKIVSKQIEELKNLQLIPNLEISQDYKLSNVTKRIYRDIENPIIAVTVWELVLEFPGFNFNIWIDSKNSKIYQIALQSTNKQIEFNRSKLNHVNYFEYLDIPLENMSHKQNAFGAKGRYYYGTGNNPLFLEYIQNRYYMKYQWN